MASAASGDVAPTLSKSHAGLAVPASHDAGRPGTTVSDPHEIEFDDARSTCAKLEKTHSLAATSQEQNTSSTAEPPGRGGAQDAAASDVHIDGGDLRSVGGAPTHDWAAPSGLPACNNTTCFYSAAGVLGFGMAPADYNVIVAGLTRAVERCEIVSVCITTVNSQTGLTQFMAHTNVLPPPPPGTPLGGALPPSSDPGLARTGDVGVPPASPMGTSPPAASSSAPLPPPPPNVPAPPSDTSAHLRTGAPPGEAESPQPSVEPLANFASAAPAEAGGVDEAAAAAVARTFGDAPGAGPNHGCPALAAAVAPGLAAAVQRLFDAAPPAKGAPTDDGGDDTAMDGGDGADGHVDWTAHEAALSDPTPAPAMAAPPAPPAVG